MKHIFYNINEAFDFAESVGVDTANNFNCRIGLSTNAGVLTKLGKTIGFDIDGFSDVCPLIYVYDGKDEQYAEVQFRGYVLHLLETDSYYYIIRLDNKGKYGLKTLTFLDTSYNTFHYFRTELVAPQQIGKANKTKILNWVMYAQSLESEKLKYFQARKDRRDRALENIRKSYPSALFREVGKVWNPYDFAGYEVVVHPAGSAIRIKWEFDGCGSIGRTYAVEYEDADAIASQIDGSRGER